MEQVMTHTVLRNAKLVLPDQVIQASLSMKNGLIDSIDSGGSLTLGDVDLEGDYLIPGLVEIHTDNLERHLMPRPKVQWSESAAILAHDAEVIASGITTVFDALGVGEADVDSLRGSTWEKVVLTLDECASRNLLRSEHFIHVRCELPAPNTIDLFKPFLGHQRVALISLMDHTPGQRQWEDINQARVYYIGKKGWSSEKFEHQLAHSKMLQETYVDPNRRFFVDYCRVRKIALASHDDTTALHVEQAFAEGASMSEFPTTIVAAQSARQCGMLNVMGAPNVVRGGSHSGNVAAAVLARLNLLDVLSSDYVPSSLLSAVMRLVHEGVYTLAQAVATVSRMPAMASGLTDRGSIECGLRADLVQIKLVNLFDDVPQAIVRAVWRQGKRVL
jgi:alpha-D-ribose 1-methylphosphonate 5-triphosphate diphosphatase